MLADVGGRDGHFTMRNMLSKLVTREVAVNYSFLGSRGGKHSFKALYIYQILMRKLSHIT